MPGMLPSFRNVHEGQRGRAQPSGQTAARKYGKYNRPFSGLAGRAASRISVESAVFRGQPEGLVAVFARFGVARRSFSGAKQHSSRLELHENGR